MSVNVVSHLDSSAIGMLWKALFMSNRAKKTSEEFPMMRPMLSNIDVTFGICFDDASCVNVARLQAR